MTEAETGGMARKDRYTEGGMDRVRRMGEGWKEGWKEECDRWVVPGQSWEGAERLASQGERTHTNTHTHTTHTATARTHTRARRLTCLTNMLRCQQGFQCLSSCQENVHHLSYRQTDGAAATSQQTERHYCSHIIRTLDDDSNIWLEFRRDGRDQRDVKHDRLHSAASCDHEEILDLII